MTTFVITLALGKTIELLSMYFITVLHNLGFMNKSVIAWEIHYHTGANKVYYLISEWIEFTPRSFRYTVWGASPKVC